MTTLALVTGASSGLGNALCHALAKRAIPLIIVSKNPEKLKTAASLLPSSTIAYPCDLANAEQRKELIRLIHEKKPDLIINNAGFGLYGPTLSHPLHELKEMIEINAGTLMEISIEGARALIGAHRNGTICNISSTAAFFSIPSFSLYAATKAFVNRFSEGLDAELKNQGVRVLTVCPGQIETGFRKRASRNFPQAKDRISMQPEKAAELVLKQIAKGRSLSIIDWRYNLFVLFGKLLPKQLLQASMKKQIDKRYHP